jgi:hypothetical protein
MLSQNSYHDVATATLNAIELLPVESALLSTKPFSIEPCFADRAAVALVEFKASIILIVSL